MVCIIRKCKVGIQLAFSVSPFSFGWKQWRGYALKCQLQSKSSFLNNIFWKCLHRWWPVSVCKGLQIQSRPQRVASITLLCATEMVHNAPTIPLFFTSLALNFYVHLPYCALFPLCDSLFKLFMTVYFKWSTVCRCFFSLLLSINAHCWQSCSCFSLVLEHL